MILKRLLGMMLDFGVLALLSLIPFIGIMGLFIDQRLPLETIELLLSIQYLVGAIAYFTILCPTFGQRAFGLKTVCLDGTSPLSFKKRLRRAFCIAIAPWGFITLVMDKERRTIWDMASSTKVVISQRA